MARCKRLLQNLSPGGTDRTAPRRRHERRPLLPRRGTIHLRAQQKITPQRTAGRPRKRYAGSRHSHERSHLLLFFQIRKIIRTPPSRDLQKFFRHIYDRLIAVPDILKCSSHVKQHRKKQHQRGRAFSFAPFCKKNAIVTPFKNVSNYFANVSFF